MQGGASPVSAQHGWTQYKGENKMPLTQVAITLIAIGVLLWLVNRYIPMQSNIKSVLNGIVVIVVVLWLMNLFGLLSTLSHIRVGS